MKLDRLTLIIGIIFSLSIATAALSGNWERSKVECASGDQPQSNLAGALGRWHVRTCRNHICCRHYFISDWASSE
jgi:hypothetical protein